MNWFLATAAAAALFSFAAYASTDVVGYASPGFRPDKYTVTSFPGPHHPRGGQICLEFTRTGGVGGFKNSGTWVRLDSHNDHGNWVYDSGFLRFYGVSGVRGNEHEVTNYYVDLSTGQGGFDEWYFGTPPLNGVGDGMVTLTRKCL